MTQPQHIIAHILLVHFFRKWFWVTIEGCIRYFLPQFKGIIHTIFVTAVVGSVVVTADGGNRSTSRNRTVFNNDREADCDKKELFGEVFWAPISHTLSDLNQTWQAYGDSGSP